MTAAAIAAPATVVLPTVSASASEPIGTYVVVSAPPTVSAGATSLYAIGVRNTSATTIGSFHLAVPAGFTPHLPLGSGVTPRGLWPLTLQICTSSSPAPCAGAGRLVLSADAKRADGSDRLFPGEVLVFAFQAIASRTGGVYPWLSGATTSRGYKGPALVPTGTTPTVTVLSNAATALRISGLPSGAIQAGTSLNPVVTALDAFGNVATGYRGTVHFSLDSSGQAAAAAFTAATGSQAPGDYTFTTGDAGTHTFSGLVLTSAPAQSVTVTDAAGGLSSAASTVTVTPGPASSLVLSVPTTTPAGVALLGGVTAFDTYGNIATGYTGTVGFSVTGGSVSEPLPADYAFTPSDLGSHSVMVTLTHAGQRTLTAGDGTLSSSALVTVTPAPATKLTLTPDVTTVAAGVAFNATAAVSDQFDNLITDYTGTVHLTSDSGGSLPPDYTFVAADGGTHLLTGLTLTQATATTLTATDTANASLTGSALVDVTAAPATQLAFEGDNPTAVTAGDSVPLLLTARDPYGNIDPTYGAGVSFTCIGTGTGNCPAGSTFSAGQASSAAVLTLAGSGSVVAMSGELAPATLAVDVAHGDGAALSLTTAPPTSVGAGVAFGLAVSVVDGYGNLVSDYPGSLVTLAANPAGAPFPVTATTVGGVATFTGITVNTPGGYALTASSPGLSDTGTPLTVTAGPPATIVVTSLLDEGSSPRLNHPVVGQGFDTSVAFFDSQGNPSPVPNGVTVTLGVTTGTGVLGGTTTAPVPSGSSQVTIVGSTYSVLENAVTLSVSAAGLTPAPTPGAITIDIAGQAVTAQASPGVPLPPLTSVDPITGAPCAVSATQATCSQLLLNNGASATDPVYLYQTVCANAAGQGDITCKSTGGEQTQLVYATATLKDANGNPLYSRSHPAALVVQCYVSVCVKPGNVTVPYSNNPHSLGEDVAANPLSVTVFLPGAAPGTTISVTGDAKVCKKAGVVGSSAFFCLDPSKSGRDANGNFTQYLLFYGDPLAHNR